MWLSGFSLRRSWGRKQSLPAKAGTLSREGVLLIEVQQTILTMSMKGLCNRDAYSLVLVASTLDTHEMKYIRLKHVYYWTIISFFVDIYVMVNGQVDSVLVQ